MFVGFNLKNLNVSDFEDYYEDGCNLFKMQKDEIKEDLRQYICKENILSGNLIEQEWFPNVNAEVFLSHSHIDDYLAVAFAGWLKKECNLTTFIDSHVWGYANDLLKEIDNNYCVNRRDSNQNPISYSYSKRNVSSSHVHLMLEIALQKMIDKTECLMFLNTPNSINIEDNIEHLSTLSPWIYSELFFSKMVRHKKLKEYRKKAESPRFMTESAGDSIVQVQYEVDLQHLYDLTLDDLKKWRNEIRFVENMGEEEISLLDILYIQKKLIEVRRTYGV